MIPIIVGLLVLMSGNDFQKSEDSEKVITQTNNEFSFKAFKILSKNENDVMSSLSILSALSILMNGAKDETQRDLKKFLQFKNSMKDFDEQTINNGFRRIADKYQSAATDQLKRGKETDYNLNREQYKHRLNMVNRVIYNNQIQLLPEFSNAVKVSFKGDLQRADFEKNAVEETNKVNEWVRNKTNNKIQKVFDKLETDTTVVIVNVVYFKGIWTKEFSERVTSKMEFYNNGVTAVKTDTMVNEKDFYYGESSELDSQVLEMDYMGGVVSFVVVLPKQRNGLNSLKEKLNANSFENALKSMTKRHTRVFLPKFKVEKSYDLKKDINPKPIAFTRKADLSRMTSVHSVVDKIIHKVFIEVNEKGTEAAAVTAISAVTRSGRFPFESALFKADHPFLYFIRDKNNSMILFSGQINKF